MAFVLSPIMFCLAFFVVQRLTLSPGAYLPWETFPLAVTSALVMGLAAGGPLLYLFVKFRLFGQGHFLLGGALLAFTTFLFSGLFSDLRWPLDNSHPLLSKVLSVCFVGVTGGACGLLFRWLGNVAALVPRKQ